jgi:hypothetical protein
MRRKALILTFDPNRPRASREKPPPASGVELADHRLVIKIALLGRRRPNGRDVVERLVDRMLASAGDDHAA